MIKNYRIISSLSGLLFLFISKSAFAQTSYSFESEFRAQASTQEELPFWMYSNQRGRISPGTNALGLISGKATHLLSSGAILEIGGGGIALDGFDKKFALDEAYVEFRNDYFYITGGAKQQEELYNGLSATNENILWSLNAHPLPGLEIGTTAPILLFRGVGFEGSWAEYILEKDRHVPWARVHHKSLHLVLMPQENWLIKVGIQHFAQWGGVSPDKGPQPEGLTDYLRIFSGRQGGEEALQGDRENSLGNHLGSWEIEVHKKLEGSSFSFIYNNIFEDGSGSRFANFPDGRYGIFWRNEFEENLINGIYYEFYYTRNQSHDVNRWGGDNYLNHRMTYNSGWTYFEKAIGAPFFLYDKQEDRIINNKFTAHHLGMSGDFGTYYNPYPYRLLLSYSHNEGTYHHDAIPSDREPKILSTYFTTRLYNGAFDLDTPHLLLDFIFAADFNNLLDPNFGAGISLKYSIE